MFALFQIIALCAAIDPEPGYTIHVRELTAPERVIRLQPTDRHCVVDAVDSLKRFHRLAHENKSAYGGAFQAPADLYKKAMSPEGHRHYPLRAVKALRQSVDLLLPLGPFLDDWGAAVASHKCLTTADRAETIDALVRGCRKLPGQQGYYRALAGMAERSARAFEDAVALLPAASRKDLRSPETRRLMAVPRGSFESRMGKCVHSVERW